MTIRTYENLNIAEAAKQAGFSILLEAIIKAGLAEALQSSENITVFAPDNDAFNELDKSLLENLLKPENKDKLVEILKYHVISGEMPSDAVVSLDEIEMMNGKTVEIFQRNGDVLINDARVIQPDIKTKNGIIHVIDKVLIPE